MIKKIVLICLASVFTAITLFYGWWSLIFFPDDYAATRSEAGVEVSTPGSQVMTHRLIDLAAGAFLSGNFSEARILALEEGFRNGGLLVKHEAFIGNGKSPLVRRAGTGLPGIWVDERSSLMLPAGNSISFRVTLGKKPRLEMADLAAGAGGRLRIRVESGKRNSAQYEFEAQPYRNPFTPGDVALRFCNRGFPRAKDHTGWNERGVDLERWAGMSAVITLSYEADDGAAFIANPVIFCAAEDRRYNVIYLVFDGVSTRHWSMYNPDSALNPFMKRVADREFVVFDNMFTLGDKTRISTSGLFCSLFPFLTRHGINRNFIPECEIDLFHRQVRRGAIATLPDVFRRQGFISEQFGNSGFTVQLLSTGVDYGFERSFEFSFNPYDSYGLSRRFFEFLRKNHDREFFTYLHYNTPHKPFYAPAHYYLSGLVNSPLGSLWRPDFMGCLRYTDDVFENIYNALKTNNLLENTIIVVATDHGAGFDLSKFDSGFQYADFTRMTFMVRLPESLKRRLGVTAKRIPAFISSINNAPTLCELAGVPAPAAFRGKSFVPVLAGQNSRDFFDTSIWCFGRKTMSVITSDFNKYILTFNEEKRYVSREYRFFGNEMEMPFEEIYNLKQDPLETKNLLNQRYDLLAKFRAMVLDLDAHHPERTILAFAAADEKKRSVRVKVRSQSPVSNIALYGKDMAERPGLTRVDFPGESVCHFSIGKERVLLVIEVEDDRKPLSIEINENGARLDQKHIFASMLDLNLYQNPVVISGRSDYLVLNSIEMPDLESVVKKRGEGLFVKIARMDLHRWIDLGSLEQKGISAGMKETLKSWGYIQ